VCSQVAQPRMPQIEITAMTFGPYGIGHSDGKAVMAPHAVPGDLVEVKIATDRRDYAIAKIERVLRASRDRREPPCPYLPRCGGCDWQQVEYSAQLRLKAGLIAAEFHRALGVEIDADGLIEPARDEFGYRSRIRLKVGTDGRLGFHELGSNSLVAIDRCIVAAGELRMPVELARALGRRCMEIEVVGGNRGEVLVAYLAKPPSAAEVAQAQRIVASDGRIAGIILRGGGGREVVGKAEIAVEIESGCVIEAEADLFSQVNRAQNLRLVAAVIEMAGVSEETNTLDLFCGAGNFSLPMARRGAQVTGVDADTLAIDAARRMAARMGLREAQFIAMRAAETANFLARARYRPEVVIMDPPRTGAPDLMEPIVRLRPRSVIYVSCDPSTLVRDLRSLVTGGYRIDRVRAFDFFPNTHHVEVAVNALLT
jgi:23S rRNA (uracil1939-C5)-methyltransferase